MSVRKGKNGEAGGGRENATTVFLSTKMSASSRSKLDAQRRAVQGTAALTTRQLLQRSSARISTAAGALTVLADSDFRWTQAFISECVSFADDSNHMALFGRFIDGQ